MTITRIRGLTRDEFEALKASAKSALHGIKFSMRQHNDVQYARGKVDIRPVKAQGWRWTAEEVARVRQWIIDNDLYTSQQDIFNGPNVAYVYGGGFTYLAKIEAS